MIYLHDSDQTGFPNLALMKLSAYYRSSGREVAWYDPLFYKEGKDTARWVNHRAAFKSCTWEQYKSEKGVK